MSRVLLAFPWLTQWPRLAIVTLCDHPPPLLRPLLVVEGLHHPDIRVPQAARKEGHHSHLRAASS